ncbi:excinuclease ABC subunit A [Sedimentimonas flavescens]|uniref:Excinuclease ABC subunit A n=1 Tax=Sedimentimonas flavescens TaxID=2851012 RepID=A0ABT2ZY68_9RHOB|nr:excinuclease ABC subunit A [Sedimentimonas flavescens]MCV2878689.1 excinuclease ABC subunit A [Sedimentimonas flavescens]
MKHFTQILFATALILSPLTAHADGKNKDKVYPRGFVEVEKGYKGCPPGLAKKNNGCMPPGQVKHRWNIGDRIHDDYYILRNPDRYGLNPRYDYWSKDDYVYRVDRRTGEILDLIGAVSAILR